MTVKRKVKEERKKSSKVSKQYLFKVGLSPSRKICFICFNESTLKMMKNAFYFILKAFIVLKIFKFLSELFVHVVSTACLER